MSDGADFAQQAGQLLRGVGEAAGAWYERWVAVSQSGYSDTSEALIETDTLLATLEQAEERWRDLDPPAELSGQQAEGAEALGNLTARLRELVEALEGGDFERLRVVSQTVELGVQQVDDLHASLRAKA